MSWNGGGPAPWAAQEQHERTVACIRDHRASWVVVQRNCNHSRFNGSRYAPSDYSEVICESCKRRWRTRAAYVATLPDWQPGQRQEGT